MMKLHQTLAQGSIHSAGVVVDFETTIIVFDGDTRSTLSLRRC